MYKTLYNLAPATCTVCNIIKLGILYVTLHISVIFMQGRLYFTTHIFHPRLRLWNDLSESLMNAKLLDIFKRMLLNHTTTSPALESFKLNYKFSNWSDQRQLEVTYSKTRQWRRKAILEDGSYLAKAVSMPSVGLTLTWISG